MFVDLIKKMIVKGNFVLLLSIPVYFFRLFPIKNNRILFVNFSGQGFGDSPKYIANCLLNSNYEFELYWVIKKNDSKNFPSGVKTVKLYSLKFFYILATSKVWVSNSRLEQYVVKRKGQVYIQTWHGGLSLKKIEYDAEDKLSDYYRKVMANDNKYVDFMISNSQFCTNMYRKAFRFQGKILEIGTPRNDIFVKSNKTVVFEIKKKLSIPNSTKVLLYVPTFRNDYQKNPYDIVFYDVKKILESTTKESWVILTRLHPRLSNQNKIWLNDESIIDVTNYPDIQELILISDMLITDYSSTMFEGMIAGKDVIIYANDMDSYSNERGYYFNFEDLPFPVAQNNTELLKVIELQDKERITFDYENFKKEVGLIENGDASVRICDLISEICMEN